MDTVERPKKNSFKSLLSPTADYLLKSNIRSDKTTFRHIQLLVLDLNGTLLAKNLKTYYTRPHIYEFMEYIYSHFQVVFWTSATEGNMNRMITFFQLYPNPLLCWSRRHIGLTEAEFFDNVITVKDLNMVWERLPWYNLFNTIIVDDSPEKVCLHPHNLVQLSTFDRDNNTQDTVLLQLKEYLEKLQYQSNVANYIKHHPLVLNNEIPYTAESSITVIYHAAGRQHVDMLNDTDVGVHPSIKSKKLRSKLRAKLNLAQAKLQRRVESVLYTPELVVLAAQANQNQKKQNVGSKNRNIEAVQSIEIIRENNTEKKMKEGEEEVKAIEDPIQMDKVAKRKRIEEVKATEDPIQMDKVVKRKKVEKMKGMEIIKEKDNTQEREDGEIADKYSRKGAEKMIEGVESVVIIKAEENTERKTKVGEREEGEIDDV